MAAMNSSAEKEGLEIALGLGVHATAVVDGALVLVVS